MPRIIIVTILWFVSGALSLAMDVPPEGPPRHPDLRDELLRRMKVDQEARTALVDWEVEQGPLPHINGNTAAELEKQATSLLEKMPAEYRQLAERLQEVDADNTQWMKATVERHGWLSISLVGKKGAQAAWLLVQHADADVKFQRQCLDLMTELPEEQVSPQNLAYLTDRVLLAEGKKQRYGTQFIPVDGRLMLRPVEDEGDLDSRRKAVGLPPIAEYLRQAEQAYGYAPQSKTAEPASAETSQGP